MAKHDFIFVDESGDTGYALDPNTGELLGSSHFLLAALHVTDSSIARINRHVAAFRFYTGFDRELKFPPERDVYERFLEPIRLLSVAGHTIHASVVYLDKKGYSGNYLKPGGARPQSEFYFWNRVLRSLLEFHFANFQLESDRYDLILDRIDRTQEQIEDQRRYLEEYGRFPTPRYVTHASSIYVEPLQVVDHIARGFKNVAAGGELPNPLTFVARRDITENLNLGRN